MACLRLAQFFEQLDDLLCPKQESRPREVCQGNYNLSKRVLDAAGFDSTDVEDIFGVLRSQGACCDCEALYNVVESSRLKAEYWRAHLDVDTKHVPHSPHAQQDRRRREDVRSLYDWGQEVGIRLVLREAVGKAARHWARRNP